MIPPFKVRLASAGNPDMGQDPRRRKYGAEPNRTDTVMTLREAAARCREFIELNDLGGGNWAGGQVHDGMNQEVAYVSYNGRVWEGPRGGPHGNFTDLKEIKL